MKIFIWQRVGRVSGHYHDEGGLAVVAQDLEHARDIIRLGIKDYVYDETSEMTVEGPVGHRCGAMTEEPTAVYELWGQEAEALFIFEDSGCC